MNKIKGDLIIGNEAGTNLKRLSNWLDENGETLKESAFYTVGRTYPVVSGEASLSENYRNYPAYNYTTQAALVEVDKTGQVRVVRIIAAHDVGKVLNLGAIKGQIEGGILMGVGYALQEQYALEKGFPKAKSLRKIGVPSIKMAPEIEIILIEDPEPTGPFGAKGVSEVALVPTAPAITNAIYNATGIRVKRLPVSLGEN